MTAASCLEAAEALQRFDHELLNDCSIVAKSSWMTAALWPQVAE
jgi:hypothetical protein